MFSNSLAMKFFCIGSKKNHIHCFRVFLEKVNLSPAKRATDDAEEDNVDGDLEMVIDLVCHHLYFFGT